ncbi:MAG: hypothetical protein R3Y56_01915 [Akkermansia sp.]
MATAKTPISMRKFFRTFWQILAVVFPIAALLPREASAKAITMALVLLGCLVTGGVILVQNYQQVQQERGPIPEPSALEADINAQLNQLQQASKRLRDYRENRQPNPAMEKILQDYQAQKVSYEGSLQQI